MPILKGSASDFTSTVKGSAEVNAAVGGAVARKGGNTNPPRSLGAIAAIVTQSAIAKSSGLQPTQFRVLASTPAPAPAPPPAPLPTFTRLTLTTTALDDIFIVKYNNSGGLNWAARVSGASVDTPSAVTTDTDGNVYVAGYYLSGPITFYNQSGSIFKTIPVNTGSWDGFIVKYTYDGQVAWVSRIIGIGTTANAEYPNMLTTDTSGNVFVIGTHEFATLSLYNQNDTVYGSLLNGGINDTFLIKYNSNGLVQWATRVSGTASEYGNSVVVDTSGNIYICGSSDSSSFIIFNRDGTQFKTVGPRVADNEAFIIKFNSDGFAQWCATLTGNTNDIATRIQLDSSNNIYASGTYTSTSVSVFNQDNSLFKTINNGGAQGSSDSFIVKYNSSGMVQWATSINGIGGDIINSIATDSSGNIYIAGQYTTNPLMIYNQNQSLFGTLANLGNNDAFLVKYDSTGIVQWSTRISGTAQQYGNSINIDSSNNIIMGGYYASPATIYNSNGDIATTLPASVNNDIFIVKYNSSGVFQSYIRIIGSGQETVPNTSLDRTGNLIVVGQYTSNPLTIYSQGL